MLGNDDRGNSFGWICAKPEELFDPHFDALLFAVTGAGVNGGAFNAELKSNQTINKTATCSNAQSYEYGTSALCTGAQYLGVAAAAFGFEDFGFRFRFRLSAHAGARHVMRLANGAVTVYCEGASGQWEANDGTVRTYEDYGQQGGTMAEERITMEDGTSIDMEDTGAALTHESTTGSPAGPQIPSTGTWYNGALEREGNVLVWKVNGVPMLRWENAALSIGATDWRVGTDQAAGADAHFQDIRLYSLGTISADTPSKFMYASRYRRYITGVPSL